MEKLPTQEEPLLIGNHKMYFLGPRVQVIEFEGDVDEEQMRALWGVGGRFGSHAVSLVRDVGNLGRVSAKARKVVAKEGMRGLGEDNVELRVYIINANVMKRALIKLLFSAVRVVSTRPVAVTTPGSMAEALALAIAYGAEIDAQIGPVK